MFSIKHANTEIAYGIVRLSKIQFDAVREFMHTEEKVVTFPGNVRMVHQGSGFYRLLPKFGDLKSTERINLAIRLIGRAIKDLQRDLVEEIQRVRRIKEAGETTVAYVDSKNWNAGNYKAVTRKAPKQQGKPNPKPGVYTLESRVRIKGFQNLNSLIPRN